MSIKSTFKWFFGTTNTILDLTSVGLYTYTIGRSASITEYGQKVMTHQKVADAIAQLNGSFKQGLNEISGKPYAIDVIQFLSGAAQYDKSYKPNWENLNTKIDSGNLVAPALAGVALYTCAQKIGTPNLHAMLAFPLACIIDRDSDTMNDPLLAYTMAAITLLDIGHWLTSGPDTDEGCDHYT